MNASEDDSKCDLPEESSLFQLEWSAVTDGDANGPNQRALAEALRIIAALRDAGFVSFLAGGCVRDALLNRKPKDFDVATNATPDSVREVFGKRHTLAFGAAFGVIGVLPPRDKSVTRDSNEEILPTEVATFRSDGDYSDGRRPDSVVFGDAEQDALRRDFRINGMFYDPHERRIIDFVGGMEDLRSQRIRTIGRPSDRFDEDKLRMLRAVRFATVLGFQIDPDTVSAIKMHADQISVVSGERVGAEMRKVIASTNADLGLQKLRECNLEAMILPELQDGSLDQVIAMLNAVDQSAFVSNLALLLIGHGLGVRDIQKIAGRWKLSNEEVRQVQTTLKHWKTVASFDSVQPWSRVQPVLIDRDAAVCVRVAKAAVSALGACDSAVKEAEEALGWPAEKLNPAPLLVGGDLARLGLAQGPVFAKILKSVREQQLDGKIGSKREAEDLASTIASEWSGPS